MIKIFVTGGTFDKDFDEKNGKLFFRNTHMNEILALGRSRVDVDIETLMMIDSLDMTDENRDLVIERCTNASEGQIIITHGTDTMTQTAKELGKRKSKKPLL